MERVIKKLRELAAALERALSPAPKPVPVPVPVRHRRSGE